MNKELPEEKDWKKFERLVGEVQKQFANGALIEVNTRLPGMSGIKRQIDVLITGQIEGVTQRVAIECKDEKPPIDITDIHKIEGLFDDVGITNGIIVSASGFTKAALTRSRQKGLKAYRLVDTGDHKWKMRVSAPSIMTITRPVGHQFKISTTDPIFPPSEDVFSYDVFTLAGKNLGNGRDLFREEVSLLEDSPNFPSDQEFALSIDLIKSSEHYVEIQGQKYSVNASVHMFFEKGHYYGQYPISKISGFQDQHDKSLIIKGFNIGLDMTFVETILSTWEKLTDEQVMGKQATGLSAKATLIRQDIFVF